MCVEGGKGTGQVDTRGDGGARKRVNGGWAASLVSLVSLSSFSQAD